tara:strand:- start:374 stop:727 length:354 start_codon:yes stop_codon:yes gene_type:complete
MDGIFLDNVFRVLGKKRRKKNLDSFSSAHFSLLFFSSLRFGDILLRRRKEICVRERERERERTRTRARKEESDFLFALLLLLLLLLFDISLTFYRYKRERERERIGCGEKPPPKRRG